MHSFLVSSRRAIPTVLWAFCPLVLQLIFVCAGRDAHTTVGGFLCSLGILPAGVAINFLFVRAGCPHYGGWFFMY
jgi:hypothetical protein